MMRTVAMAAVLGVAASCSTFRSSSGPSDSRGASGDPSAARSVAPQRSVEDERRADEIAYQFLYVPEKKRLENERPGKWVAIVVGRVVPATGARIEPAKSMEDADAAARAVAPDVKHRFVFQVGEDGDVEWPMGGCELQHVVGTGFLKSLYADVSQLRMDKGLSAPIEAKFGEEFREITVKGPDARIYLKPEVGAPGADGTATEPYCVSTGFGGCATMSPASASAAGLELWEIPGSLTITESTVDGVRCRRARARFRWTGTKLDFALPVAVWTK
jgi:hypothetical protein